MRARIKRTLTLPLLLGLLVSGCVNGSGISDSAICDGTRQARAEHAAALAQSADDRAVVTGAALIDLIDAGCR